MRAKTFPDWKITDHKLKGECGGEAVSYKTEITIAVSSSLPGGQGLLPRALGALFENQGPTASLHFLAKSPLVRWPAGSLRPVSELLFDLYLAGSPLYDSVFSSIKWRVRGL